MVDVGGWYQWYPNIWWFKTLIFPSKNCHKKTGDHPSSLGDTHTYSCGIYSVNLHHCSPLRMGFNMWMMMISQLLIVGRVVLTQYLHMLHLLLQLHGLLGRSSQRSLKVVNATGDLLAGFSSPLTIRGSM